jgi:hypothetical protein
MRTGILHGMKSRGILLGASASILLAVVACGPDNSASGISSSLPATSPTSSAAPVTSAAPPSSTGSTPTKASAPPPASTTVPPNTGPVTVTPGSGTAVPSARIDSSAIPGGPPSQVWTQDNGTVVGLVVEQSGCDHVSIQVTEQTATTVVLTIVHTAGRPGEMCPMIVREVPVGARLSAPLGNRQLVLRTTTMHG